MRRIDDPSASPVLPAPEAAGTEGYFTEGTPGVTPATLVRASFLNMVQEELRNIVVAGGLIPAKTVYNQVLSAIKALVQQSAGNYALDTGLANSYQVAYAPAVAALVDGMVLKFRAKAPNTGASTFSPNGLAAAPIWGGDHAPVGGGEIVANGAVWLQWNGALNGGAGAWLLIDSTGGYLKSPTPAQFDNSAKVATMAALQRQGLQYAGINGITGNKAMTAADVGKVHVINATSAITLPLCSSLPAGSTFTFFYFSGGVAVPTFGTSGSDVFAGGINTLTSYTPKSTGYITFTCEGPASSVWEISGSGALDQISGFGSSFASSGYQKLPSGLIIQWGQGPTSNGSGVSLATFPVAFPNACLIVLGGYSAAGAMPGAQVTVQAGAVSATQAYLFCFNSGVPGAGSTPSYFAIGR
ncbi:hypothetical protein AAKU55_005580 [Oxalobacteraceae bacterium GrIS 1.11]